MDGKANGTTPFQEFTLLASIEMAEDGLYRVNAKLMPKADVVVAEEGVEHDGDSLDEMAQTAGRFKEMGKKISATERDLERAIGTKRIGGTTTRLLKLYDKDAAEARSEKLYGRGGKVLKRKPDPNKGDVQEMAQTPARQRDMEHKIQRHEDKASRGYSAKMTMSGKAGERGRKQEARHDRASQRLIKQDRKEWESPYLYGRGGKILTSKGKKKKDPDFMKKVKVKEEVEQIDELSKATKDAYVAKRGSQLSSMLSGHTRGKQLTGKQQANAVKGIKQAMGVSEELVGGQKKIDANKNGKLDAQDFKMLRAKKKPVQEEAVAEAKKFKAWTPRLDKLMKNRDAVRVTPKKKTVKEYTEMMGGISLTTPDPTESIAGKQGSGRKFHKKAQKNVAEAMKKPSKPIKKTLKNKKKSKGSDYVHDWETKKIDSRDSTWW
jgi:hypothetical protein